MDNKRYFYITVVFLSLIYNAHCQTVISGVVYDSATQHCLPYSNAFISGTTVGAVADETGHFKFILPDSLLGKEMVVTMLGYSIYSVKNLKSFDYSKYKEVSLGAQKANAGDINFAYGSELASFIPNNSGQTDIIKTIRFYITKKGFPTEPFGANLYELDVKTGEPGANLVDTCFILSAKKGNEWVELDISKYHIPLPRNGFFISMRWLPNSKNDLYTFNGGSKEIVASGQSLSATKKTTESRTFTRNYLSGWSDFSFLFNAAIGADIMILEDK